MTLFGKNRVWIVLALAMVLRIVWAVLVPVHPLSDAAMYDQFARSIVGGQGYALSDGALTAYWPVGASALLAGAYAIFGPGGLATVMLNLVLGGLLVLVTQLLAERRFGPRAGVVAGLMIALWPTWIAMTTFPSSELPCALFVFSAMLAWSDTRLSSVVRVAIATALLVAAGFMRPTVLPLIAALPLMDILRHRSVRRTAREMLVALVVMVTLIAPWAIRNYHVLGEPVPVSTNFGVNLWMGNNARSTGLFMEFPETGLPTGEIERDAAFKKMAIDHIKSNPGHYLQLSVQRAIATFSKETVGIYWNDQGLPEVLLTPLKVISTLYWYLALVVGLYGLFFLVRRDRWLVLADPLILASGLVIAVAILVVGGDRYHLLLDPILSILAGFGFHRKSAPAPATD